MREIYAEIITIGDEILYGQILDTNSQWISQQLDDIGVKVRRKYSISDQSEVIKTAVNESLAQSDLVFVTGGLGPTKDDLTKHSLAAMFEMPLELNQSALEDVEDIFKRFGKELTEINRQQAFLPKGSTKITNERGTAPGMWFDRDKKVVVSMPGVPFEMKAMMTKTILPKIKKRFQLPVIIHKVIRTIGIGESWLSEEIARWENALPTHLALAYLPGKAQVRLRLTGVGEEREVLEAEMEEQVAALLPTIQSYVYGFGDLEIEEAVGELLRAKSLTIATAESCTGGYLAHKITSVSGSSDYYTGSVIAYQNEVKIQELNVSPKTIEKHGAVSEETAKEMAEGIRKKLNVDLGISLTGIAGPDGGTEEKPVGMVWMAISFGGTVKTRKIQSPGTRILNIEYSGVKALDFIRQTLIEA
ncbi:competence/damage-inducible protein A [Reichenbachiella agariperforans]|uniref:CinA-like protein n=1 Tax=Reichenbachiella agariperforans TaxID=156994 RepID=A0A1M6LGQ9_REIAG|nr:competence/damage-inducible protein A [Reichenbachiella agariperforans]MBU2913915.1 competence/damage-inducible protein A [Reichenbachiella agariperforans]SHJ70295.1 competence/damage-inducible protein cinA [Reichenbachiella agariperforans]